MNPNFDILSGYANIETIYTSESKTVARGIRSFDSRKVILKYLNEETPSLRDITRLNYEYKLSQKIQIDGMIPILNLERIENRFLLVMEDVGAIPFLEYWNSTEKSIALFIDIALQISEVLSRMHQHGIIHKDIKPANILIHPETSKIYIIDLGFASELKSEEQAPIQPENLEGSLSYISPEQTGRMNRSIDFRSDLYSLGVTFYELLLNQLPFSGNDPIELVHAHIATSPTPPSELNTGIPKPLSMLILKLLSKNAEDRYQTTTGLRDDLVLIQDLLSKNRAINFIPGENETRSEFSIPQNLYGREAEVYFLLEAYEKSTGYIKNVTENGDSDKSPDMKLVLVGGYSGIGKTALINEIHKPILENKGYFVSGKFDQFKRNIPYSAIIQAFTRLIRQILTEKEDRIQIWRTNILELCSSNVSLLTDLIPELISIVGQQKVTINPNPDEAEERFRNAFIDFVNAICSKEHPLTLFIDDLQWADLPTLKMIELLVKSDRIHYLFIIGAYRDNEVDEMHPLSRMTQNFEKEQIKFLRISLSPLNSYFIEQMINDTLRREVGSDLPSLVEKKTNGNPFFIRQFLKSLYEDRCIFYDSESGWNYDLDRIKSNNYTDNVVELVASRILTLSEKAQSLVKIASCIGDRFEIKILALVLNKSIQETGKIILEALKEGIILPLNQSYKSAEVLDFSKLEIKNDLPDIDYKFAHDRVQQAANSLLTSEEKMQTHVDIGHILLDNLPSEHQMDYLFEITNHLNYGLNNINLEASRSIYLRMNYLAGVRAEESFAYDSAIEYLQKAKSIIGDTTPKEEIFRILYELLNAKYKYGKVEETNAEIDNLFNFCETNYQKALVFNLKVLCQINLGDFENSMKTCRETAGLFGIEIKENVKHREIYVYYKSVQKDLKKLSIDDLYNLPLMEDRELKIVVEIIMNTATAGFWIDPNLGAYYSLIIIRLTLDHGLSFSSSFGFGGFGTFLLLFSDYETAYNYGQLALRLSRKIPHNSTALKIPLILGFTIYNWVKHSKHAVNLMLNTFNEFSNVKDIVYSSSIILNSFQISFIIGNDFNNLTNKFKPYSQFFRDNQFKDMFYAFNYLFPLIERLRGNTSHWFDFSDEKISEEEYLKNLQAGEFKLALYMYYITKLHLEYLFLNYSEAYQFFLQVKKFREYGINMLNNAQDIFFSSLVLIESIQNEDSSIDVEKMVLELNENMSLLKKWSDSNPANFKHKYLFVLAKNSCYNEEFWTATIYFDEAIVHANENGYILDAGMICEHVSIFYSKHNRKTLSQKYRADANYYYNLCGATAKLDLSITDNKEISRKKDQEFTASESKQIDSKSHSIDIQSIIKSTSVLSAEMNYSSLLKKLLYIMLENAGAQRIVFLIIEGEELFVQAIYNKDTEIYEIFNNKKLNDFGELPNRLINFSKRTSESVILENASQDAIYGEDKYIQENNIYSALTLPILLKGSMIGLLYMENNLLKGAFTHERVKLLTMIAAQAAISLENSKLLNSLEEKVYKRTIELEGQKKSIQRMNEFIKKFNETPDLNLISKIVLEYMGQAYKLDRIALLLVNEIDQCLDIFAIDGFTNDQLKWAKDFHPVLEKETGSLYRTFISQKTLYLKRIPSASLGPVDDAIISNLNLVSFLHLPLVVQKKTIGIIFCSRRGEESALKKRRN
jgi:predicted ATPase/tRNA A-37 threonylcarbamoyl transferase component Bud32